MALRTRFLRNSKMKILGTIVEGYGDGHSEIRDFYGRLIGRVLPGAAGTGITKNMQNEITTRTDDPGFVFGYSRDPEIWNE
jgi:hypothetical protein